MFSRPLLIVMLICATLVQVCVPCCILSGHCSWTTRTQTARATATRGCSCGCCRCKHKAGPELPASPAAPPKCPLCDKPVDLLNQSDRPAVYKMDLQSGSSVAVNSLYQADHLESPSLHRFADHSLSPGTTAPNTRMQI